MSIHGVLGETTIYPTSYDKGLLFAIDRQLGRGNLPKDALAKMDGVDVWQAFELSWLDDNGLPKVAIGRFVIPALSPFIVESKSLKLYLNSLNFSRFASEQALIETITNDLSACVGADCQTFVLPVDDCSFAAHTPKGVCIDNACDGKELKPSTKVDKNLLGSPKTAKRASYAFYSHLLRSNCPVTNQPDWGTVQVVMTTDKMVSYKNILRYVLSYRQHNGFHEACVEQIFADLLAVYAPTCLRVQANYTRRGGIDINPVRFFGCEVGAVGRLLRQ